MNLIEQNPYRVLGVLTNSSTKEIAANYSKIKAFVKVGRSISFENDLSSVLRPVIRSEESLLQAYNAISVPKGRLYECLFWFMQLTDSDTVAFNHLKRGNINKAIEVFENNKTVSSIINLAVLNFILKNWTLSLFYYSLIICDVDLRENFLKSVAIDYNNISENEMISIIYDKLIQSFPDVQWLGKYDKNAQDTIKYGCYCYEFLKKSNLYKFFSGQLAKRATKNIDEFVVSASNVDNQDASQNLEAAKALVNNTRLLLETLCTAYGDENIEYVSYCDKVANQIVNNCIYYYNHDLSNPGRARNILALLEYAGRIAVGAMTKSRCEKNYAQINNECNTLVPMQVEQAVSRIGCAISEFYQDSITCDDIPNIDNILSTCFQQLEVIKQYLGQDSVTYISASADVVYFGMNVVMEKIKLGINGYEESIDYNIDKAYNKLLDVLQWGKCVFVSLQYFTKDDVCAEKFTKDFNSINLLLEKYNSQKASTQAKVNYHLDVIAPTEVIVGKKFLVKFAVNFQGDISISFPSFYGIEVLGGPTKYCYGNRTIYEFLLKTNNTFPLLITSAVAKIGTQEIQSLNIFIEVKENNPLHKSPNSEDTAAGCRTSEVFTKSNEKVKPQSISKEDAGEHNVMQAIVFVIFTLVIAWVIYQVVTMMYS